MNAATTAHDAACQAGHDHCHYRQKAESDVYRKHARDHGHRGKAVIGGALIKMRAVRLPDRFPADGSSQQGDRGVGEIVERRDQRCDQMAAARDKQQQNTKNETDRQAADVAEKNPAQSAD